MHTFHILWQILMKLSVKDSHLMSMRSSAICENQCSDSHTKRNFALLSTLFLSSVIQNSAHNMATIY